jgi:hypothetical protein
MSEWLLVRAHVMRPDRGSDFQEERFAVRCADPALAQYVVARRLTEQRVPGWAFIGAPEALDWSRSWSVAAFLEVV